MGLSMSPVLKSPSTSLASEPQMPDRIGRVTTQSGRTRRASSIVVQAEGDAGQHRLELVLGRGPDLSWSGGAPKSRAFTTRLPRPRRGSWRACRR